MTSHSLETNPVVIELKDVSKHYKIGAEIVRAVDEISLHVIAGEIVVIMGPSGSGKTTLIQLIGALLKPTSGDVIVNGVNVARLGEKKLPHFRLQSIGFIFQTPNLISSLTALQNVELVLNLAGIKGKKARLQAEILLKRLNLQHRLHHKPSKLSGGEQQRVAIARALANDPMIILADEPTANLDSKTGHEVMELLKEVAKEKGKTVVIVTHDPRITDLADRILWLEDGKISLKWAKIQPIDPVCLMTVEETDASLSMELQGSQYYFCSLNCKKAFEQESQKYIKMAI